MAGAARLQRARAASYGRTLAGAVVGLTRAGPRPRLEGVGRTDSLRGCSRVRAVTWAVDDDVGFFPFLPWAVGVAWAGSQAVLGSRTVQVAEALSWAVARAEHPSVIQVCVELSIGARVPLLPLLLQVTVHLPVSPQLLLELLNCQWKLLKIQLR